MAEDRHFCILVVNPGSTSSKVAVFDNETCLFESRIDYQAGELAGFPKCTDQFDKRMEFVRECLAESGVTLENLSAVVGRGGLLRPIPGGTYEVNQKMVDELTTCPAEDHASNLGALIARHIASGLGIPAYIVDPVCVDEMEPVARISGLPGVERVSQDHPLNGKAVARIVAERLGESYSDLSFVIAHLGSGFSISAHDHGKMVDLTNANNEGPFSVERAGGLPASGLIRYCFKMFSGGSTAEEVVDSITKRSGLFGYLGTKDLRQAEKMAESGDERASLIVDAMAYQVSKAIGEMAVVLYGHVDRIILTGGAAKSERLVREIVKRVQSIAPIEVMPGELEMEALAWGALRVLRGQELPKKYQ